MHPYSCGGNLVYKDHGDEKSCCSSAAEMDPDSCPDFPLTTFSTFSQRFFMTLISLDFVCCMCMCDQSENSISSYLFPYCHPASSIKILFYVPTCITSHHITLDCRTLHMYIFCELVYFII